MPNLFERESLLQETENGKVRCNVCERRCLLVKGGTGWCRSRQNHAGKLMTITYGALSSLEPNPIEKKPFYHFYPGTFTLTAGGWSCNFGCPWCQNWGISKSVPRTREFVPARRMVELTENSDCQGTSISFNEPTLSLEWSLEVFELARRRGLYNTYVTNGYMTPEALGLLIDAGLDAMNVDVKGDAAAYKRYCKGIDVERVWNLCKLARERGVHLEITTLVVPTVDDDEDALRGIAERILGDLGPDVPWHVTGYYPAYEFTAPRTSTATLERAWQIGRMAGLHYVYVGNRPGHEHDNTYCPNCNALLIRRMGFEIILNVVDHGRCPECGASIAGVWY